MIRPGAIGDCILALPAMQFLKAEYTEVWVPSVVAPLIQFAAKVDSLAATGIDTFGIPSLPARSELIDRLRAFDEVVSWYGANRGEFRDAMRRAGVDCIFHSALPPPGGQIHASDFFCLQVGAPTQLVSKLDFAPQRSRGSLVIHPFSGSARKNWPLRSFQNLAVALPMPVEWLAGPEEHLKGAVRFQDLGSVAEWLCGAAAYVGNDSGITHLAAATGVPTLALFGPTDPQVWGPRGSNSRVIRHDPLAELPIAAVRDLLRS